MTVPQATKVQIAAQVCAQHKAGGLQPDEVVVKDNGEIWIDRSARDRRNVPFLLGRWEAQ